MGKKRNKKTPAINSDVFRIKSREPVEGGSTSSVDALNEGGMASSSSTETTPWWKRELEKSKERFGGYSTPKERDTSYGGSYWDKESGFTDWFGRKKEDSYSFYQKEKKYINWESPKSTYSSFFSGGWQSSYGRKHEASKIVKSMSSVMGESAETKFSHQLGEETVYLPFHLIPEGYKEADDIQMDAFYGASLHHIAEKTMQEAAEYRKCVGLQILMQESPDLANYFRILVNDERIHKKVSGEFSGYSKFIQKFKEFKYSKRPKEFESPIHQFIDLMTRVIRYPDQISEEECEKFAEPLDHIKKITEKFGGIPEEFRKGYQLGGEIANYIKKYLQEQNPPLPEYPEDKKEGKGDGEEESLEGMSGSSSEGQNAEDMESKIKKALEKIYNDLVRETETSESAIDPKTGKSKVGKDELARMESTFNMKSDELREGKRLIFTEEEDYRKNYESHLERIDLSKARAVGEIFKRLHKDHRFVLKSMKSGRLDTAKMAEAVQGVPTVYERPGQVKSNKLTVAILIDESGSMGGWTGDGRKINKAAQAAIMLNESFKNVRSVELFIYGHTADENHDGSCDVSIYREPGKKINQFSLGRVHPRSNNRDGFAILSVAQRIRKMTTNPGVLIVISDGQPAACGYDGMAAIRDTREKVKKAEALGFQVVQIAIESSVPSEQMFTDFVKMTNIQSLPGDLISYLKPMIRRQIKEKVIL